MAGCRSGTYGVEFDVWFRERDLHAAGELEKVIEYFREKGYLYEEEGARGSGQLTLAMTRIAC